MPDLFLYSWPKVKLQTIPVSLLINEKSGKKLQKNNLETRKFTSRLALRGSFYSGQLFTAC